MWIVLNDAFLSVVQDRDDASRLLVRGRVQGDIERVFPGAEVVEREDADYRFRAHLPRAQVVEAIAGRVDGIDYTNFKNTVAEDFRHEAYFDIWAIMHQVQMARKGRA